ncbi:MAG: response regulator [Deltaproteobacteria bacterium]|nr:response regulator [Deltaproteobacteria bacterium]
MSRRVLTVDDDPDITIFVKTVLEENGYTPLVARNGEAGLSIARDESPDLIILDVLMPKQSGIRMYRELKSDESLKDIPVIILSGIAKRTFLRSQEALTEFGDESIPEPDVYIEKPVEPVELAETLKGLIG